MKYGKTVLKKNVDYTVSYYWNVDAGTASMRTIRGKGNYEGTVYTNFHSPKKLTAKNSGNPGCELYPGGRLLFGADPDGQG